MHIKSTLLTIIPLVALGCVGEDEREKIDSILQDLETAQSCNQKDATSTANRISKTLSAEDFGDGSDGEFYLPNEGTFSLEEKVYNFSNVNLEPGSVIRVAETANNQENRVEIHSLGVCNIYNAFEIADYTGEIVFHCYSGFDIHGALTTTSSQSLTIRHGLVIEGEGDSGVSVIMQQRGEIFGDEDMEVVFQLDGGDNTTPGNTGGDIDDGAVVIGGDSDVLMPPASGGNTITIGDDVTGPGVFPILPIDDSDTITLEPGTTIVLPVDNSQVNLNNGDLLAFPEQNGQTPEVFGQSDDMQPETTIPFEGTLQPDTTVTSDDEANDSQDGDEC